MQDAVVVVVVDEGETHRMKAKELRRRDEWELPSSLKWQLQMSVRVQTPRRGGRCFSRTFLDRGLTKCPHKHIYLRA